MTAHRCLPFSALLGVAFLPDFGLGDDLITNGDLMSMPRVFGVLGVRPMGWLISD